MQIIVLSNNEAMLFNINMKTSGNTVNYVYEIIFVRHTFGFFVKMLNHRIYIKLDLQYYVN